VPLLDLILPVAALPVAVAALRTARRRRSMRMPLDGRMGTDAPGALAGLTVLLVATVAQLTVSGWRWQLVPAGFAAAALALALATRARGVRARLARTTAVLALLGAALSLALSWAFPVQVLDAPTGPHAVGTTTMVVTDDDRPERYGPEPGAPREIVLQLWYPADPAAPRTRAPLIPQASAFVDLGAAELGLPRFALSHLGLVRGHATRDAAALPVASPVALLAHGWTGFRTLQTDLAEQLASEGWIVAAADHRYGALVTTFPDGRADLFDPDALPEFDTVDEAEYERLSRTLIATFAEDLALVLTTLEDAPPAVLEGRIDASTLAMLGHSTGGGAAIAACAVEPRCDAVVGFDPWVDPVDPAVQRDGTGRPLLSLRTQDWIARPNEAAVQDLHGVERAAGTPEGLVRIDGALHRDYTLIGALSPAAGLLGLAGDTPSEATREATTRWTSAFLRHHVLGEGPDPLVTPPSGSVAVLEPQP